VAGRDRRSKPHALKFDDVEVIRVHERVWRDDTQPVGQDLRAERGVKLFGVFDMFKHLSNEQQAELAMKMATWLFKYARWIKGRPEGRV